MLINSRELGIRRDKIQLWMRVRFACWLASNGAVSDEEILIFAKEIALEVGLDSTKLPRLWKSGTIGLLATIKRIEEEVPGICDVYFLPWELFDTAPIGRTKIRRLVSNYIVSDHEGQTWRFPNDETKELPLAWDRKDSHRLSDRGDIYALFAILSLVREAEVEKDYDAYNIHFMNLVRCLPWSASVPWLAEHFSEFCRLIQKLHDCHAACYYRFGIDWHIIHRQFLSRHSYKPRNFRARGPDGRYLTYADPVIHADFVNLRRRIEF